MAEADIKSFFQQKKKRHHALPAKSRKASTTASSKKKDVEIAVVSDSFSDQEECDDVEAILREFDLNPSYGPCVGLSRMERWERAASFGLNPSLKIRDILMKAGGSPQCLWESRV